MRSPDPLVMVMDEAAAYNLSHTYQVNTAPPRYDYSAASGMAFFNFTVNGSIHSVSTGGYSVDYLEGAEIYLTSSGQGHTGALANLNGATVNSFGDALSLMQAAGNVSFTGTNHGDIYSLDGTGVLATSLGTGTGNDIVEIGAHVNGETIIYRGGNDIVSVANGGNAPRITMWEDITPDQVTAVYNGSMLTLNVAGHGSLIVNNISSAPDIAFSGGGHISFNGNTPVINPLYSTALTIAGTWESDTWTGHNGRNETVYAYGGNDVLNGGTGNDTLYGGDGNDSYVYGGSGEHALLVDSSGTDLISVTNAGIHADSLNFVQNGADLIIGFGPSLSGAQQAPVFAGDMTIAGFYAGAGNSINTLHLADGSPDIDLRNMPTGNAYVMGTANADELHGFDFAGSVILGLGGDDHLYGGAGNDKLYAGDGNDTVDGGAGDDIIDGGTGVNDVSGGAGNDTYYMSGTALTTINYSEGADAIITDQNSSSLFEYSTASGLTLYNDNGQIYGHVYGSFASITFADHRVLSGNDIYTGNPYFYTVSDGDDYINLYDHNTCGDFVIDLLSGNDQYNGNDFTDIVNGGDGNDVLNGNYGNDILIGGAGYNDLRGGQGNDVLDGKAVMIQQTTAAIGARLLALQLTLPKPQPSMVMVTTIR